MTRLLLTLLPCFVLTANAQVPPAASKPDAPAPEKKDAPSAGKPDAPAPPKPDAPVPAKPDAPTAEKPYAPPKLKGFTTGKWPGMVAVFQSKKFDATLSVDRILSIQPKEDGKPIGAPVTMHVGISYSNGHNNIASKLVSIERQTPPAMQPSRVEFLGLYERKEKLSTRITFSDVGINFSGDVRDPAKLQFPSIIGYALTFGRSHDIPQDAPIEEMKKLTEGYSVKFYDQKRVMKNFGYWEAQPTKGNIAEAQVIGPWGPRRLSIEMPATRESANHWGAFANYSVHRFFKGGWSFYRQGTDKIVPGPLILRVD